MPEEILEDEPLWLQNPPKVVAVLVAHRAERWLATALESHKRLEFRPDSWIAVHDGVDAETSEILNEQFLNVDDEDRLILTVEPGLGFGAKVAAAIESAPTADWYWLLHDDLIVQPETLAGLLNEATTAENIGAVGPKVREWPSLRRLLEVGVTIGGTGHRETGLEPGEPDAGQFDRPRDVLSVGTAGMLVRAKAWNEVNGFDPQLPLFGDDIDFGWRLNRAAWRVRTAPESVVFHAEASRSLRRNRRGGVRPRVGERRAAGLYTVLANESSLRLPFVWFRLFFGSLIRAFGFLVGKDFHAFRRELAAVLTVFAAPRTLWRARAVRKATIKRGTKELKGLRPSFLHPYLHGFDLARTGVINLIRPEETPIIGYRAMGMDIDEHDFLVVEEKPPVWRRWPWLTTVAVLLAGALVAARSLPPGDLYSDVLMGAPNSVVDWWHLIVGRAHELGVGSVDWPSAAVIPLAGVSTFVWFEPGLSTWALLIFAVPLSAMAAHRFGRQLTDDRIPRMVWAVSYGLLVATSGAIGDGRIGTVVALVLVPVVASGLWRLVEAPGWVRLAQVALVMAVAAAFAPIMWWIYLLVLAVLAWRWPSVRLAAAGTLLTTSLMLGPSLISRVFAGARVWWEAGRPIDVDAQVFDVAFGLGGAQAQAPWWIMLPIVVLGVLALAPKETRWAVTIAWSFSLIMLGFALVATVVTFSPGPELPEVSAWSGIPAVLWLMGLLTAALIAAPAVRMRRYRRYLKSSLILMLLFPVMGFIWFVGRGVDDPLSAQAPPMIPAYLTEASVTTLVLTGNLDEGIVVHVVNDLDGVFGTEGMGPNPKRSEDLQTRVESLLSRPTIADVEHLAGLGIGAIYSPEVDTNTERRIDAVPGLSPAGTDSAESRVWTVDAKESAEPADGASVIRPVLGSLWLLIWIVVTIMALPFTHSVSEEEEQ